MNSGTLIGMMQHRIHAQPEGSAFVASDFTDLMDYDTAKKSLLRLEQAGKVRRVLRGIYDRPQYSELLQEYAAPKPDAIASALARNYSWTIAPCGNTALNQLGLSTQVTANWSYISSGPYKSYTLDRVELEFLHRADKDITGKSPKTAMIIQALKALGSDQVDEVVIRKLSHHLSNEEKKVLLSESQQTTAWIFSIIKKICRGET